MKTRFTPLVGLKKNTMQKSERVVQRANKDLVSAKDALESAYKELGTIELPTSGTMAEMLASRTLFSTQTNMIEHNKKWVNFAASQLEKAKEKLKLDMIEHEKFKYLELQEIKKALKEQKIKESKELDEIALMRFKKATDE